MTTDVFLNGKRIHISFGAPSMRGRKVIGDLVPYNTWWRTAQAMPPPLRLPPP
jgi:hypothetical protein